MNEYVFSPDFAVRHNVYTLKDHPGVLKLVVRSRGAVRYAVLSTDQYSCAGWYGESCCCCNNISCFFL